MAAPAQPVPGVGAGHIAFSVPACDMRRGPYMGASGGSANVVRSILIVVLAC